MAFLLFTATVSTFLFSSLAKAGNVHDYDHDKYLLVPQDYVLYKPDKNGDLEKAFHELVSIKGWYPKTVLCYMQDKSEEVCNNVRKSLLEAQNSVYNFSELINFYSEQKNKMDLVSSPNELPQDLLEETEQLPPVSQNCTEFTLIYQHLVTYNVERTLDHIAYICDGQPSFYITSFGLMLSRIFVFTSTQGTLFADPSLKEFYLYGISIGDLPPPPSSSTSTQRKISRL